MPTDSCIYLVVKESGAYSQWDKENICYFDNEEDANKFVEIEESKIPVELRDRNRNEEAISYHVEVISVGIRPA